MAFCLKMSESGNRVYPQFKVRAPAGTWGVQFQPFPAVNEHGISSSNGDGSLPAEQMSGDAACHERASEEEHSKPAGQWRGTGLCC